MKKVISLIIVLFISVSSLSLTMTAAKETGDFVCGIWKYSVYPDHVTITGVTTPVSGKIEIPVFRYSLCAAVSFFLLSAA